MKSKVLSIVWLIVLSLVMITAVVGGAQVTAQGSGPNVEPATVMAVDEIIWYTGAVAISTTTYYYGPTANGTEGQNVIWWQEADILATIDIVTGTQTFTITPQFSMDGTNWADADYVNPDAWSSSVTVTTVGVSGTLTTTVTEAGSSSATTAIRQIVVSADATELLSLPLYGKYMRLKTEVLTTAYQVIPTFYVVLKNK